MKKKLLLADDSITIQKVVGIILSTEEYQLEITDDGDRAFAKALEEIPDLVIADVSMPGMDGFELCRSIKSEPALSGTSVLLLPGAFDQFDEEKATEVGADGWLTKPFESQALLDKVSQLLEADPIRLSAPEISEEQEVSLGLSAETAEPEVETVVSEEILGLDAMDDLTSSADKVDDESADDIWDTVSFAEEDLQVQGGVAEESSVEDVSFAEEVMDPSAGDDSGTEAAMDASESGILNETSDELEAVADAPDEVAETTDFSVFSADEEAPPAAISADEETVFADSSDQDEELLELVDELEDDPVTATADVVNFASPLEEGSDAVAAVEDGDDLGADEVIDLTEEEIVELELEDEPVTETVLGEFEEDVEQEELDPQNELDEQVAETIEPVEEEIEPVVEEIEPAVEEAELLSASESLASDDEDDIFYFDESAEASDEVPVETLAVGMPSAAVERVESQLGELSEEELQEVVSKVAGPIIEKLAKEMLEKIAWEVVPDLAEAMISEEIRKIKQGD